MDKYQKLSKTFGNLEKIANFLLKNAKFRYIKILKTKPLLLKIMQCSLVKPQRTCTGPWSWKNSKNDKIFQKTGKKSQKLVSFCMFVFVVPKHIAHKTIITSYFVSEKAFIIFQKLQRKTNKKKFKKITKNMKNCNILSPKTPKNDLLTFN